MNNVSYFKKITSDSLKDITWSELCALIKSDDGIKATTASLRQTVAMNRWDLNRPEHKKQYQKHKVEILPGFMPGGTFITKTLDDLTSYSQVIHVDFDNLTIEEDALLQKFVVSEPSVCLSFVSPGGMGRKIFHVVRPSEPLKDLQPEVIQSFHIAGFQQLTELYEKAGLLFSGFDKSVSNVNRACFLSHDQDAYVNEQSNPFIIQYDIEDSKAKVLSKTREASLEDWYLPNATPYMKVNQKEARKNIELLIVWLQKHSVSITEDYHQWLRVVFALKATFDEETAKYYARLFSEMDASFNATEFEKKFNQQIKPDRAPTLGTIFYFAKSAGYNLPEKKQPGYIFFLHFVKELARHGWQIRDNVFTGYLENYEDGQWKRFTDRHLDKIKAGVFNHQYLRNNVQETINVLAPSYDPIKQMISKMPEWDGHDHLLDLTRSLNSREEKWPAIFVKKWFVGFLAGLTIPEHYNENVLILQGDQGDGKTRWIRRIFDEAFTAFGLESDRYFKQKQIDPENKDDLLLLCTSFVVFFDEMNSIVNRKADIEAFKNMTSATAQTIRKPYGRHTEDFRRYASIIATVNEVQFLADSTGNRRFWVIPVGSIDQNHSVNILQSFAQAWHLMSAGEKHYLTSDEIKDLHKNYLTKFETVKAEEELIRLCVHPSDELMFSTTQILGSINNICGNLITCAPHVFGKMLRKYFGDRHVQTKHGQMYRVVVREPDAEIFTQRFHGKQSSPETKAVRLKKKSLAMEQEKITTEVMNDFLDMSIDHSPPPYVEGLFDTALLLQNFDKDKPNRR